MRKSEDERGGREAGTVCEECDAAALGVDVFGMEASIFWKPGTASEGVAIFVLLFLIVRLGFCMSG